MPEVVQKGKKHMKYVPCPYCDSYISFYITEVKQEVEEVFGKYHTYGNIKCPACSHKITVISNGEWKEGVVDA